jgi:GT2 family glycosyltransferase
VALTREIQMTAPAITLCLVNFEGAHYLPKALEAAQPHAQFSEILVVDNASTDDSVSLLRGRYPHVRILQLDRNLGPAGARNAAYAAVRSDLILFQDNDVQLTPDCVALLYAALRQSPGTLLVAPRVLYAQNPELVQYDSADCHFLGLMITRNANRLAALADQQQTSTTSLVTSCFLFDRSRWDSATLFDESFGFNYEDHDFGVRACTRGHQLLVEPRARVLHAGGTPGLSYRPGGQVHSARVYYLIRNRWYILTKVYAARTLFVLAPILLLYEFSQLVGALSKGWGGSWLAAVGDYWRELPRLLRDRRGVQTCRRIGDRSLLKGGPLPLTSAVRATRTERIALGALQGVVTGYWRIARLLL